MDDVLNVLVPHASSARPHHSQGSRANQLPPDAGSEHQGGFVSLVDLAQRSSADDRRCIDRQMTDTVLLGRQAVPDGNLMRPLSTALPKHPQIGMIERVRSSE